MVEDIIKVSTSDNRGKTKLRCHDGYIIEHSFGKSSREARIMEV